VGIRHCQCGDTDDHHYHSHLLLFALHFLLLRDVSNTVELVTPAGCDVPNESALPLEQALNDQFRINFYRDYIVNMTQAMAEGGKPVSREPCPEPLDIYSLLTRS
jgi:hypothetical protein